MLSGTYKALLVKLFYMNEESATVALRKFRLQKNVKTEKEPLTMAGLKKLVRRFEETGSLEGSCPVKRWKTVKVNVQRYLMLLHEIVAPYLREKDALSTVTFMQDGTSHTANPGKKFLIQSFGEERIIRKRCKFPWPLRFLDLTPEDCWLWGYLKSQVYRSRRSNL
ncbi:DUF4817 domain-containing protein [Nephila pilipes]|uniref:DUF4817 domain-containing protein n=1 Tax=Nephila pilipes TaxID=299642 RepID=A0A8X6U9S4_NEPPI|nr:DUF4817 domain-containing protein [Nephila pilipes]